MSLLFNVVAVLPFVLLGALSLPFALGRKPDFPEWLSLSICLGYVFAAITGWVSAAFSLKSLPLIGAFAIVAIGLALAHRRRWSDMAPPARTFPRRMAGWAALVLFVSSIPRFYFQRRFGSWPRGSDPEFHLFVIRAIQERKGIPWTLLPLENVHLNYPWGSHLAVIGQSALSGQPAHAVFAAQNSVICGVLSMTAILLFAWKTLSNARVAVLAMLAYGNVMHFGSADFQIWGGLPNHAAMGLFVAAFSLLATSPTRRERALGAVLLGCAFLVHHHVMIVAMGTLGFHAILLAISKRNFTPIRTFAVDFGISLLVASPIAIPLLTRVGEASQTDMFKYAETFDWLTMWRDLIGVPGLVLAGIGLAFLKYDGDDRKLAPVSFLSALTLAFAICGGLWRVYTKIRFGSPFVAFTASRFLTDAAYPAGVLAGVALDALLGAGGGLLNHEARAPEGRAGLWLRVALSGAILFSEQWIWLQARDDPGGYLKPKMLSHLEIASLVSFLIPKDAAVIADFDGSVYGPYVLGREVMDPQRPVSEPPVARIERKKAFSTLTLAGKQDAALRRELFGERPVWIVRDRPLPAGFVEKQQVEDMRIGELIPYGP